MDLRRELLGMTAADRRNAIRRISAFTWVYPIALEERYVTMLSEYMVSYIEDRISDIDVFLKATYRSDEGEVEPSYSVLVAFADEVSAFTTTQWATLMAQGVGLAFDASIPSVQATIESWTAEQITLITKATGDMLDKVWSRVHTGVLNGWMNSTIIDQLREDLPGITERRARLIARDQTSKLRSMVAQNCFSDAGLTTYVWSTSNDERVRESHAVMQGAVCKWDDDTVYLVDGEWVQRPDGAVMKHPGMDIQCRCVATVNVAELAALEEEEDAE